MTRAWSWKCKKCGMTHSFILFNPRPPGRYKKCDNTECGGLMERYELGEQFYTMIYASRSAGTGQIQRRA